MKVFYHQESRHKIHTHDTHIHTHDTHIQRILAHTYKPTRAITPRHLCIYTMYIYINKVVNLATVVEGDLKAPFLIATTQRCREGATPFLGLLHFTVDPYLIMLSIKQGRSKYNFWIFSMTRHETKSSFPGPLVTLYPQIYIYIYI